MAKGLEDTALYRYFPLLSLNGVGGEPDWVGDGSAEFHAFNKEGFENYPLRLNASSTHDTKRSEDVRCRIHVLSEISEDWVKYFDKKFKKSGRAKKKQKFTTIDIHTEYLIYETLLGAWPFDGKINPEFIERMQAYFLKASREAKSETSWVEPNGDFEQKLHRHVSDLLSRKTAQSQKFIKEFSKFAERAAFFGAFNSLSLLTLKAFSPGVPDFYQGTELWDLSLVDPDNRRPVDFKLRREALKELKASFKQNPSKTLKALVKDWKSGYIKLFLTSKWLELRKRYPELFIKGQYFAVEVEGDARNHFVAFQRVYEGQAILVVVPRLLAHVLGKQFKKEKNLQIKAPSLLSLEVVLGSNAPENWSNVLTGRPLKGPRLNMEDILDGMPVGVLLSQKDKT